MRLLQQEHPSFLEKQWQIVWKAYTFTQKKAKMNVRVDKNSHFSEVYCKNWHN